MPRRSCRRAARAAAPWPAAGPAAWRRSAAAARAGGHRGSPSAASRSCSSARKPVKRSMISVARFRSKSAERTASGVNSSTIISDSICALRMARLSQDWRQWACRLPRAGRRGCVPSGLVFQRLRARFTRLGGNEKWVGGIHQAACQVIQRCAAAIARSSASWCREAGVPGGPGGPRGWRRCLHPCGQRRPAPARLPC